MDLEIEYITVGGKQLPAIAAVCPICNTLDLNTDFDTREPMWKAKCSKDHEWLIDTREN